MKPNVGFIGLGSMGRHMAAKVAGRYHTWVFDLRDEAVAELVAAGAHAAKNVTEIAENCNWILLSLPDDDVVDEVVFGPTGLCGSLRENDVLVDCGTTHPDHTRTIAARLAERGVAFIDAPVSGMPSGAADSTLSIMVGGDEDAATTLKPVLETMGTPVYMGASGNGQLTKMINNVLYNISCAAMAEMLPLAVGLGLDPDKVREVVSTGSGQSLGFDYFSGRVLRRVFDEGYSLASGFKDMAAVAEKAGALGAPLPVFSGALETYKTALDQGYGDQSKGAMIKVWEREMGLEVRSR